MKIEYNNLYTHFIFSTLHRLPVIETKHRERIEKYITGIVNNNDSQLYTIYANPEHVHFLVSRSPCSQQRLPELVGGRGRCIICPIKHFNILQGKLSIPWPYKRDFEKLRI